MACVMTLVVTACATQTPDTVAVPDGSGVDADAGTITFDMLDADRDSYLDMAEMPALVHRGVFKDWDADADSALDRNEIADTAFQVFDDDGNGVVTGREWVANAPRWLPRGTTVEPLLEFDADGDSELDVDEFAAILGGATFGDVWADAPLDEARFAEAYFGVYDLDDDGQVSHAEFESGQAHATVSPEAQ